MRMIASWFRSETRSTEYKAAARQVLRGKRLPRTFPTPRIKNGLTAYLTKKSPYKAFGDPRVLVTDKLRSYIKPIKSLAPNADHRAHKGLNNRAEGSHRPTRKREKIMGRFKSPAQAQRFLAAHDQINTIFRPRRYRLSAISYRHARSDAHDLWNAYALEMTA